MTGALGSVLPWLLWVLPGCGSTPDVRARSDAGPGVDAAAEPDADGADGAWPAGGITFEDDPTARWGCTDAASCVDDYLAFPERAAAWARPASAQEIEDQLLAIDAGEVPVRAEPMPEAELAAALLEGLGIGFLLDGLPARAVRVRVTARTETAEVDQLELLVDDPFVGRFPALLLEPHGPGPMPALVALHGHGDDDAVYRDDYHGGEWPARGYAILIPTLRAMNIDASEYDVTMRLLENGFDLIGLRVYEAVLCRAVLAARPEIDASRIGLIGHSGGSSTGNLVVRVAGGFRAFVSDNTVDFFRSGFELPHCETAPDIYPLHGLVNDFATAPCPVLAVPYGYPDGMDAIFRFMDEHVAGAPSGQ